MSNTNITEKEWLDLAWKHFQQHAQQRIQYFNYFVIFCTILTTALVSTYQFNFQAPYLGIGIGIILMFLSFIFWKIDERNKFLTQHAENIIKTIERAYNPGSKLFSEEEELTANLKVAQQKKWFFQKQISHSKSYKVIFVSFGLIGLIGFILSSFSYHRYINEHKASVSTPTIRIHELDSLIILHHKSDSVVVKNLQTITLLASKIDSLETLVKNQPNPSE